MYRTTRARQNFRVWVAVWFTGAIHLWAVLIVADTQQQVPGDIDEIPEDWMVDDLPTTLNYLLDEHEHGELNFHLPGRRQSTRCFMGN